MYLTGHVLEDGNPIQRYNLESGHTIHMVARPEGVLPASSTTPSIGNEDRSAAPSTSAFSARRSSGATSTSHIPLSLLNPLLSLPGLAPRNTGAEIQVDSSLEHLRQGMLTMNTLMTTLSEPPASHQQYQHRNEYVQESKSIEYEESKGAVYGEETREMETKPGGVALGGEKSFYIGQWIDVKDTVNQWLTATVMDINYESHKIFVHFNGWPVRWDEWIDWDSSRVSLFRSYTSQESSRLLSPSLSQREASSITTGNDDIRTLLPEISSLMQSLAPMLSNLGELGVRSLVSQSEVPAEEAFSETVQTMPWMRHLRGAPIAPDDSRGALSPAYDEHTEVRLRHLAAELCPLLDRFGRLISDVSPHLRVLANSPLPSLTSEASRHSASTYDNSGNRLP